MPFLLMKTLSRAMENCIPSTPLVVLGANSQAPNWQQEQNGADPLLGVFGGNPHPHNHIIAEHQAPPNGMQIDDIEDQADADEED